MSKHSSDLIMCLKLPGTSPGLLCDKCDGRCPVCDSYFNPETQVRICDECAFGNTANCVICGFPATNPAFFCRQCTAAERDRDGCPNILNVGSTRSALHFDRARRNKEPRLEA